MAAGDFVQVVGTATHAGTDTNAMSVTVPALGCANGNTLFCIFVSSSVLVGAITNSTGTDTWNLNDISKINGTTAAVGISSCQLNSALASGATITATPAATVSGKNMVVVEYAGHLTLDSTCTGTVNATTATTATCTAGAATAQANNTIILGACFSSATYTDGSAAATGWTFPTGGSKQSASGTIKDATEMYRQITAIETPSAVLTWTGAVTMAACLAAYQVPGGGGGTTLRELALLGVGV